MGNNKNQTITEEWFNAISHGITALSAVGGLVILIVIGTMSDQAFSLFSALFYGISLVTLYTASTLYHGIRNQKVKDLFNIFDHMSIYLLIAGTYTPVLLLKIGGTFGWTLFGIQWGMALFGIVFKTFYTNKYEAVSLTIYAIMGWMIVIKINTLASILEPSAFWLLVAGGLSYTIGIIFYIIDYRLKFAHFIWHIFVMAGSLLHFLMMILYVF